MPRSSGDDRFATRFDKRRGADPLALLGNLVDVMLVFACGLAVALVSSEQLQVAPAGGGVREVETAREVPDLPDGWGGAQGGYEPVGRVFREPRTGRYLMVEGDGIASP